MKIRIVALGHRMPAWVSAGIEHYASRLPREWALRIVDLRPEPRDRGRSVPQLLDAEALRIAHACSAHRVVALDERGETWTTAQFAAKLTRWQASGHDLAFVIGSADGLATSLKAGAFATMALSAMTLPHGLARVLLVEQLYRAHMLASGHPYHRA